MQLRIEVLPAPLGPMRREELAGARLERNIVAARCSPPKSQRDAAIEPELSHTSGGCGGTA